MGNYFAEDLYESLSHDKLFFFRWDRMLDPEWDLVPDSALS